jgi:hypothetical protein
MGFFAKGCIQLAAFEASAIPQAKKWPAEWQKTKNPFTILKTHRL